jgi:hypothetical protein
MAIQHARTHARTCIAQSLVPEEVDDAAVAEGVVGVQPLAHTAAVQVLELHGGGAHEHRGAAR